MTVSTCTEKEYLKFKIFFLYISEIKQMPLLNTNYMALKNWEFPSIDDWTYKDNIRISLVKW